MSASAADDSSASRRSLLVSLGAGAAGALSLAGCGSSSRRQTTTRVQRPAGTASNTELLNALLGNEYYAIAAYTAARPLLGGPQGVIASQFLGQEVLHADRLINLIQKAGGTARRSDASYDLGKPSGQRAVMSLLLAAEQKQLKAYVQGVPKLTPGPLRSAVATILAAQARHEAIWRLQLGQRPAPSAFVTGNG